MDPAPTLRYDARRQERWSIRAAVVALFALLPGAFHPLAIPEVVLGEVAVAVGIWKLARRRSEQGWYTLGVALLLQLAVLAIWLVPARSFGQVLVAVALVGLLPGIPLVAAFVLADRARTLRRLAWGRDHEERRRARTYSRLTSATPVSVDDEWAFAERALAQHEDDLEFLDRAAQAAPRTARDDDEQPPAPRLIGMPATVARTVSPQGLGTVHVVYRGVRFEVTATCQDRVRPGRDVVIVGANSPRSVVVRPKVPGQG